MVAEDVLVELEDVWPGSSVSNEQSLFNDETNAHQTQNSKREATYMHTVQKQTICVKIDTNQIK